MVVSVREFIYVTVASVVVSLIILGLVWPRTRQARELVTIAASTAVGIIIWNLALNVTNATSLNVDSPFLGLSAQDVGSGVAAFVVTFLVLRFVSPRLEPATRVLGIAAVVGLVTLVVDLFG